MLGAVLGDIIGSVYEVRNAKTKEFPLITPQTRYTDDSVMTLAVAKWLLEDKNHTESGLVNCMQSVGRRHIYAGYGSKFRSWLLSDDPCPYNSWGNGSAMRVSPVGLYAKSIEEALELARVTACVTPESRRGYQNNQFADVYGRSALESYCCSRQLSTVPYIDIGGMRI